MVELKLVGTAHVSQKSVEEVFLAIEEFQPDVIAIELDRPRFEAVKRQGADANIGEIIESGNFTQMLVQWILAYIQRRIGMDVGVEPGADMKAAIDSAESRGLPIALIDRDIRITIHRFWHSLGILEKLKLIYALVVSLIGTSEQQIDIDALTGDDMVTKALEEFRSFSPNGARALIDERDAYLAYQINLLKKYHERVLAVVGAGHKKGIEKYLLEPETIPPVESLTEQLKPRNWGRIFEVIVIVVFAFMIATIAFSGVGLDVLLWALVYWVLIHGVLTAVFTLIARGHPISALVGFGVSWFTALHPLIAAGWFSAICEAKIRKPSPGDIKKIFEAGSFKEMMNVPLFRVVLVAVLANVGSALGTIIYFIFIFPILGVDPAVLIMNGWNNMIHAVESLSG